MTESKVKLITLGDSGAGKSSLLTRYARDVFNDAYAATLGVDFQVKRIQVGEHLIRVQIWDTAGQERFRTLTINYYRDAPGIALVYDITSKTSFSSLQRWMTDISTHADKDVTVALIGNKGDLDGERQVTREEGEAFAKEFNLRFWETSAKTGTHVEEAFDFLAESVYKWQLKRRGGDPDNPISAKSATEGLVLKNDKQKRGKSRCCK